MTLTGNADLPRYPHLLAHCPSSRQKPILEKAGPAGDTGVPGATPPPAAPLSSLDGDDGYVAVASNDSNGCGDNDVADVDNEGKGCDESLLRGGGAEGEGEGAGAAVSGGGDNGRITTAVMAGSPAQTKVLMEV